MARDNRRFPREDFIALSAVLFVDGEVESCSLLDVSEGGAFVRTNAAPPRQGSRVQLHGEVRGQSFAIDAEVRWVGVSAKHQVAGFGVAWNDLPTSLAAALAA